MDAGKHVMEAALDSRMAKHMKDGTVHDLTEAASPNNPKKKFKGARLGKAKVLDSALEPLATAMSNHSVCNHLFLFTHTRSQNLNL